ncbi:MAG: sensor histidine kinase, partial [Deltaproteobacteria bacterium]|nr:sensor histidine kinase [Deltaproteobacteria bacterium]
MVGRADSEGGLNLVEAQLVERAVRRGGEAGPAGAGAEATAELRRTLAQVLSNLEYLERELHRQARDPRPARWAELQCCAAEALSGARHARVTSAALSPDPKTEESEQIDLAELLASCIRAARQRAGVRARVIAEFGDVPPLVASEGRLGRIFLNLLLNALQAAAESANREPTVEVVLLRDEGGGVRVDVIDSGPGIPERLRDTLFEPFVTSRPAEGARGLGLA